MITLLGLGPGDPKMLTLEARAKLNRTREILVRTRAHPTVAALPKRLRVRSFDALYKRHESFDAIYQAIADNVLRRAEQGNDVVYAVPGHPLFGEMSVQKILAQARAREIPVEIIAGVSFVDASVSALGLDPLAQGLQIADATDLAREHFPRLDTDKPALIGQIYARSVASDVKLTLLANYSPNHPVTIIAAAGTPQQTMRDSPLAELDRADDFGLLTTLYVPATPQTGSPLSLAEIVAHLRSPEGCPWDREQVPQSLRAGLLEEAYEVLDALDAEDTDSLREELGDLLLHVLFQTQMASEAGEFTLIEVGSELAAKLIRRHPHVFGDATAKNAEEVLANWFKIKAQEKADKGARVDWLDTLPRGLPALARAQKIYRHARRQLREAGGKPQAKGRKRASQDQLVNGVEIFLRGKNSERRLGEILFALAQVAERKHLDAESALRAFATQWAKHVE